MNGKKYPREWESINNTTDRLRVPDGWLVYRYTTTIIGGKDIKASACMEHFSDEAMNWLLEDRN